MKSVTMRYVVLALAVGMLVLSGTVKTVRAATDNFDSYVAGSSLLGTGNGQVSYAGGTPGGNPPGAFTTLTAQMDGTAQSAPNVCQFADTDNAGGSVTFQLAPAQALDMTATGKVSQITFDFKVTSGFISSSSSGPGGRVSMGIRPLYSVNTAGGSQDNISNNHMAGLSDGGAWFLNGGTVLGDPNRYSASTWYHLILTITHKSGYYVYTLELQLIGGGTLGRIINGSSGTTPDSGRTFLTGMGLSLSSDPDEIILIDNFSVIDATPAPVAGVLWASDNFDTYGGAGTNILGQNNGLFQWINGSSFGTTVTTGHVQVNRSDVQSAPNSMEFYDDVPAGSYKGRLALPTKALFVTGGEPVRLEMDLKAAAGPGGRVSTGLAAQYSSDAFGTGEDYISSGHIFGLSDNGNWFLGGGTINGPVLYQPNTWYHLALTIDRDNTVNSAPYNHQLTLTDIGTGTPLGTIANSGLNSAGRGFLTSLAINGSSDSGEVTLFDNLQIRQLVPAAGAGTAVVQDNFDSYAAGSSILGQGNSQITWINGASAGSPISTGSATITTGDIQSSPNALTFDDPPPAGSFFGQIPSTLAVEMTPDRKIRFRCDFKVTRGYPQNGPGGRVSLAFRLFFSVNAFGAAQDWIDSRHVFGISDGGLWFVDNANGNGLSSTVGAAPYQANTWYHLECIVQRPYTGQHTYRLEIKDIVSGASLGVVSASGLIDAGRPWLTGVGIYGSSNPVETTIFDNLGFDVIDPSPAGPCPQVPFADVVKNGRVDNDDFAVFLSCASGAGIPFPSTPASCQCLDRDADGDVDMDDFGKFQRCWSGINPADPTCGN